MTGALWALVAGLGFGVFQALNRRAVQGMGVMVATFLQLLVSAVVLAGISAATQDLGLLLRAPAVSLLQFALAGGLHFLVGWTLLNASQKRIGAARTSSLIATTPLFGALAAALALQEIPSWSSLAAILLIVAGVYVVNELRLRSRPDEGQRSDAITKPGAGWPPLAYGLGASACWSLSPIFIRQGLQGLPSPLLGVTVGIGVSAAAYAVLLAVRSRKSSLGSVSLDSLTFKLVAGLLVGLSTWMRWVALDLAPVALVLAITLVSVPVVNLLSPLVVGRKVERVTAQVWLGSGLVVSGSLVLILHR